ncbi:hypothetical protein BU14_2071s0001 [Porphyra umbilicalis]|uniref:Uncharacterized protein n=1 Tax=Porphyra umbilicalis TaxID=2786 RepID=A0A1X6NK04_PORUM|nr:hypothetical protein BU14_2071s0001 [Porphyra umbilicalis]|eukprot:OSX68937.1 hypothetical protein BU14_2071s0001 [Porphyra umbilicalis]
MVAAVGGGCKTWVEEVTPHRRGGLAVAMPCQSTATMTRGTVVWGKCRRERTLVVRPSDECPAGCCETAGWGQERAGKEAHQKAIWGHTGAEPDKRTKGEVGGPHRLGGQSPGTKTTPPAPGCQPPSRLLLGRPKAWYRLCFVKRHPPTSVAHLPPQRRSLAVRRFSFFALALRGSFLVGVWSRPGPRRPPARCCDMVANTSAASRRVHQRKDRFVQWD